MNLGGLHALVGFVERLRGMAKDNKSKRFDTFRNLKVFLERCFAFFPGMQTAPDAADAKSTRGQHQIFRCGGAVLNPVFGIGDFAADNDGQRRLRGHLSATSPQTMMARGACAAILP